MRRVEPLGAAVVGLAVLAIAGASAARPPCGGHPGGHDPGRFLEEHAEELGLEATTQAAIRALAEDSRARAEELHAEHREARQALRELLAQDEPDASAVMAQAEVLGQTETARLKHRLQTRLAIRALLTPAQRAEMLRIREACGGKSGPPAGEACTEDAAAPCPESAEGGSRMSCRHEQRERHSAECGGATGCPRCAEKGRHHEHGGWEPGPEL